MPQIDFDWSEAWVKDQASRRPADDSSFWDKRAPSFQKTAGTSPYARTFIEWADVHSSETVFDMGCGSGTLALPLARSGIEVWAADFSQVMLDLMMKRAQEDGVDELIHASRVAWDDDWSDVDVPVCDVAFASRSIATSDLKSALVKLDSKARRRVCVTLGTNESPRTDDVITKVVGREIPKRPDFVYAMNILWDMGITPTLDYITSARIDKFASPEEAVEKFALIYNATPEECARLEAYADKHLHERVSGTEKVWSFDHERITKWAFIAWNKA